MQVKLWGRGVWGRGTWGRGLQEARIGSQEPGERDRLLSLLTPVTSLPRISDNEDFLKSLSALTKKAKCKLTVCPEEENLDDQWMQVLGPICLRPRDRHRPWAPGAQPLL